LNLVVLGERDATPPRYSIIRTMYFSINLNTTRGGIKGSNDETFRRAEARKHVRLFLAPSDCTQPIADFMVADYLVTESMVDRFLAIDPPEFRVPSTFDTVIDEIERTYVLGLLFSALSAAVVTIERVLNEARIRLHEHVTQKIKELWQKGPLNEWEGNIGALENGVIFPLDCLRSFGTYTLSVVDIFIRERSPPSKPIRCGPLTPFTTSCVP
jgi:hypothetical protein